MSFPFGPARGRLLLGGLLACGAVLLLAGCGPDYKARGGVKGRVTANKRPLTTGTVLFTNKEGITGTAHINIDGTYELQDAPVGECKVTVTVPTLPMDPSVRARLKGGGPKVPEMKAPEGSGITDLPSAPTVPKEIIPIDAKYSNPETSGLTFTVEKGATKTFDIDL